MDRSMISRDSLKYNFLKRIIVRLDFQGVLDIEMDSVLADVKNLLKEAGFNKYHEKMSHEIDIEIREDDNTIDQLPIRERISYKVYSFIDDNRGIVLDISRSFVCVNIASTKYIPFDEYINYIVDIGNIYKEKINFLRMNRFGIRKINQCIVKDINRINDLFQDSYYSCKKTFSDENIDEITRRQLSSKDKYRMIVTSNIQRGSLKDQPTYSIILDSDIFAEDEIINDLMNNPNEFSAMNDILFQMYLSVLTDSFIAQLQNEDSIFDDGIIGVMENE